MKKQSHVILHGHPVGRPAMQAFKKAYLQAVKDGEVEFTHDKQTVVTKYAKYVVEYAEQTLGVL